MKCIFCGCPSNDSKSVEHIVPESLGNSKHVLPRGVVCDGCNNYFARKLEGPVLSHRSFRNLRAWIGLQAKSGKVPTLQVTHLASGAEVGLRPSPDGDMHVTMERNRDSDKILEGAARDEEFGLHGFAVNFEVDPPQKEMSRFLAKMALERAYNQHSQTMSGEPRVPQHQDPIQLRAAGDR